MPSRLHEIIISDVAFKICSQLKAIAESSKGSAEFAKAIQHEGSATIELPTFGEHSPDAVFQHSRATYPGIIIEMSFSQKRKDVEKLAYNYILGSDGSINVVVGLDVEYKGRKKGTLSVWRSQILTGDDEERELTVERTISEQVCPHLTLCFP